MHLSKVILIHLLAQGSGTPTNTDSNVDSQQALKHWAYCIQLARWLIEEGLIDRHDFLTWIIELLDKRTPDDGLLRYASFSHSFKSVQYTSYSFEFDFRLFLPLTLQYMTEFSQCELLARRLSHTCARKLAVMCQQLSESSIQQLNAPGLIEKCFSASSNKTQIDSNEPTMQEQG